MSCDFLTFIDVFSFSSSIAVLIHNEYEEPGGDDSPRESGLSIDLASSTNNECSMKVDDDSSIARSIQKCQKQILFLFQRVF